VPLEEELALVSAYLTESLSGTPWDKPLSAVWAKIPATGAENCGSPKSACLFFQLSGDANLTWSLQYGHLSNGKLRSLHGTVWTSYITKDSRRSQGGLPIAFRCRPWSRDSVSKTLRRGDLRPLASDCPKPASGTKQKCIAYGAPCGHCFGTCFRRPQPKT
jgi:hypothetical protein